MTNLSENDGLTKEFFETFRSEFKKVFYILLVKKTLHLTKTSNHKIN